MSLSHDSYTFETPRHQNLVVEPPELQHELFSIFGVKGSTQVVGETMDRLITCKATYSGNASLAATRNLQRTLDNKIGKLTGTLTETLGASTITYGNCTFLGFRPSRMAFYDASGANDWVLMGTLHWIQRKVDNDS